MNEYLVSAAKDLLAAAAPGKSITLDEIAGVTGLKRHHLTPYRDDIAAVLTSSATGPGDRLLLAREVG